MKFYNSDVGRDRHKVAAMTGRKVTSAGRHGGFSDSQATFEHAAPSATSTVVEAYAVGKITLGSGGRLVIPADVRARLGLQDGDALVASIVNGELHLLPVATAVQRAQAYVRETIGTFKDSVVDEFIREKRAEQVREDLQN
jgi:AbrB family looped-hinge helix DNA binding protein